MSATRAPERRKPGRAGRWRGRLLGLLLLLPGVPALGAALAPPEAPEAWLVTYGPGEIYWQRFGHNALWLREPGGLDHAFNFGFFDFEQENFLLRFVQGRMRYFAAAVPTQAELAAYAREGREVRVQRLALSPRAYARLRQHLLWHVQPEHREYRYDYYLDNCSTRLRDALDLALEGALSRQFQASPAHQDLRTHTRRATQDDLAYYFGLMTGLGWPVDRPIDRWTEQFLPQVLAEALAEVQVAGDDGPRALVMEDRVLLAGIVPAAPVRPDRTWPRYGALALALLLLGLLAARSARPVAADGLVGGWLLVAGTVGLGLAAVWAFTDHEAAYANANLLLFNPLWVLGLAPALRRFTAVSLLVGAGVAVIVALMPNGQYLADTLALAAPLNVGAAVRLWASASTQLPRGG